MAIGYMSALTHVFLGKALEVWRPTAPGIVVDCIEMDCISQERALLEGRIAVGLLVPTDRPLLELLQVRFLTKYSVKLALPKSHPEDGARMPVGAVWKPDSLIAPVQGRDTEGGVTFAEQENSASFFWNAKQRHPNGMRAAQSNRLTLLHNHNALAWKVVKR